MPPAGERGNPGAIGLSSRQSRANAQDRFRKIVLAILYYIIRVVNFSFLIIFFSYIYVGIKKGFL